MQQINTYRQVRILAMMLCVAAAGVRFAHAQTLPELQKSFSDYQERNLQEKIYVHTNKSFYLAGEILWFKIYCTDGATHKMIDLSKVAYMELMDNAGAAVMQAKIALNNGTGNGSLFIPFSLNSGAYVLRVYTAWMKNFPEGYFFEKQLTIVNPQRPVAVQEKPVQSYDVQFFPEGGHLVKGITSKVAFKITGSDGKGIDASGAVINQQNDTVARFRSLKFGIGSFMLKPAANTVYRAVVKVNNIPAIKNLPEISASGYVLAVAEAGTGWNVNIKNADSTSAAGMYAVVHNRHSIAQAEAIRLANGSAGFSIDKNKIADGISYVTLFDAQKRPVCERLIFKRPSKKLMIDAQVAAPAYGTRKKVDLAITTGSGDNKGIPADLSVSVFRTDTLQNGGGSHAAGYLWLRADLKGAIESPDYYLENDNDEANKALDNLMLSQGWTQFDWDKVLSGSLTPIRFLPEHLGPIVTGHITNTATNQPAKDIDAYLTLPGSPPQLYIAKSDLAGRLLFNTRQFYGLKEIIVQSNYMQDSTYRIEVESPYSDQHPAAPPAFVFNEGMARAVAENSLNMQVQNIFSSAKIKQFSPPVADSAWFYGAPTKSYQLDNFTRFTTMEEVLREYVTSISIAKRQGKFEIEMFNVDIPLPGKPFIMLDGVPLFDADKIFKIDPLKIRRLEVISHSYLYGPAVLDGIMSFTTYKGDGGNFEIDPHAVFVDYDGLQAERKFYSPVYDSPEQINSTLPDFRSALYWNPNAGTRADGKTNLSFYTSDKPGTYIGIIEGISDNGEAGSQVFHFEVKK